MELNLNYEAVISAESSEFVGTSESDEGSENDEAIESSNPMSPVALSSIVSSSQIVTKGVKGQLFKSRPNKKPNRNHDNFRAIFFDKLGVKATGVLEEFTKC